MATRCQVKPMCQRLQPLLPSTSSDEAWRGKGCCEDIGHGLDGSHSGPLHDHVHAPHQPPSLRLLCHQVGLVTPNEGFFHGEAQGWRVNHNISYLEDMPMIYGGATAMSLLKKALTTHIQFPKQHKETKASSCPQFNLENDSFPSKDIKFSKGDSIQEATHLSENRNTIEENPMSTSMGHSIKSKYANHMAPLQASTNDHPHFGKSSLVLSSFSESDDEYAPSTPRHLINNTHVGCEDTLGVQTSSPTKIFGLHKGKIDVNLEDVGKVDDKFSIVKTRSLESIEETIEELKERISHQRGLPPTTLQRDNKESNKYASNPESTKKCWSNGTRDQCTQCGEVEPDEDYLDEDAVASIFLKHLTPSMPNTPIHKSGQGQQGKYRPHKKSTLWTRGEVLGEGAYGKVHITPIFQKATFVRGLLQVFAGLNQITGELMAVKQLKLDNPDDQSKERDYHLKALQREINLYKTMKHKHIVRYIDMDEDEESGSLYIFLEYVSGGSIQSMLERFGAFNEQLVQVYTRQLLLGLEYLHGKNLVHRDIKGGNVLVDAHGIIKLADFGASKIVAAAQLFHDAFETNGLKSIRGSVFWMAPEVIKGDGYGRRADIWSLGCTIIEMMTGEHPWPDLDNTWSAIFHIAKAHCGPPMPKVSSDCAKDFLRLCFTLNPKQRPTASKLLTHPFVWEPLLCQDPNHLVHP